jgi:hypothetical protein
LGYDTLSVVLLRGCIKSPLSTSEAPPLVCQCKGLNPEDAADAEELSG